MLLVVFVGLVFPIVLVLIFARARSDSTPVLLGDWAVVANTIRFTSAAGIAIVLFIVLLVLVPVLVIVAVITFPLLYASLEGTMASLRLFRCLSPNLPQR